MGVSVREKPKASGYWWLFIRHKGQRVCQYVAQEKEVAEDAAQDIRKEIRTGRFDLAALKASRTTADAKESVCPTLSEYFDTFEKEYLQAGVRQSTREAYRGAFDLHIIPELGDKRLDALTRVHVKAFMGSLMRKTYQRIVIEKTTDKNGKNVATRKTIKRPLSKASIRIITASLCACLNHAREDGYIQENPANRLTRFYRQAKAMHPEIQPLTAAEVPVFLKAAREHTKDYYVMFLTMLHTGVRSGECSGLRWGDLDFNSKFVIVRRTVTPSGRIENTKTDRVRRVDMSDELAAALQSHRKECLKQWLKKEQESVEGGKPPKEKKPLPEWVFANQEGKPPDMHNVKRRAFLRALEKAGMRRIRMHDLRHSYASILISAGVSPAYVQQQLGHASIKLTVDTYTHLIPGAGRHALAALPVISSTTLSQSAATSGD